MQLQMDMGLATTATSGSVSETGKKGFVVLLCLEADKHPQTDGWERAPVITYERFIGRLLEALQNITNYAQETSEAFSFINQMHRKYTGEKGDMNDREALDFVTAMCATGETGRYRETDRTRAAEKFAADVAPQARERFGEGFDALNRVKLAIMVYGEHVLAGQMNSALGSPSVGKVSTLNRGIYQWSVDFQLTDGFDANPHNLLQVKFGPSAWFAIEEQDYWKVGNLPDTADYTHLFLTNNVSRQIVQSAVSLGEVLNGLGPDDTRLRDVLLAPLSESQS